MEEQTPNNIELSPAIPFNATTLRRNLLMLEARKEEIEMRKKGVKNRVIKRYLERKYKNKF
jgi:hypothetical protein